MHNYIPATEAILMVDNFDGPSNPITPSDRLCITLCLEIATRSIHRHPEQRRRGTATGVLFLIRKTADGSAKKWSVGLTDPGSVSDFDPLKLSEADMREIDRLLSRATSLPSKRTWVMGTVPQLSQHDIFRLEALSPEAADSILNNGIDQMSSMEAA